VFDATLNKANSVKGLDLSVGITMDSTVEKPATIVQIWALHPVLTTIKDTR
jgi:hypothetical protein